MTKDEAIQKAFKELSELKPEEFKALLDSHKDGEIAKLLEYGKAHESFLQEQVVMVLKKFVHEAEFAQLWGKTTNGLNEVTSQAKLILELYEKRN